MEELERLRQEVDAIICADFEREMRKAYEENQRKLEEQARTQRVKVVTYP